MTKVFVEQPRLHQVCQISNSKVPPNLVTQMSRPFHAVNPMLTGLLTCSLRHQAEGPDPEEEGQGKGKAGRPLSLELVFFCAKKNKMNTISLFIGMIHSYFHIHR